MLLFEFYAESPSSPAPQSSSARKLVTASQQSDSDSSTRRLVTLPATYLTFFDIDANRNGRVHECVRAAVDNTTDMKLLPVGNYTLSGASSDLIVYTTQEEKEEKGIALNTTDDPGGLWDVVPAICAKQGIGNAANPSDPQNLTPTQREHSVVMLLENVASFKLLLSMRRLLRHGTEFPLWRFDAGEGGRCAVLSANL